MNTGLNSDVRVLAEAAVRRNLDRAIGVALAAEEHARRGNAATARDLDLQVRALANVGWKELLGRERAKRDEEVES